MTTSKKQIILAAAVLFSIVTLFSGCGPRDNKAKSRFQNIFPHQANELMQTITGKLRDDTLKNSLPPEIEKAIAERIRTTTIEDVLPPTGIIIFGMMIPIVSILAFLAFLIVFVRLYHIRIMAMIEKGSFERKSYNIRWELVFLFFGIVLAFLGPAISVYMTSMFGFHSWTITGGIIPLFIGVAILIYYKLYNNMKKNRAA